MSENETRVGDALRLLDTLREEEVKSFLETLIDEDQAILSKFLRRFGSVDLAGLKADLLYDLREAVRDNSYYGDGYVDWRHASFLEDQIFECLDNHVDVLVDRGDYEAALALGSEVYLFLTQVDVDDSDGFTETMLCALDETWDDICDVAQERSDDGLFRLVFDKLSEYLSDKTIQERAYSPTMGNDIYLYQCEHIEEYLVGRFSTVVAYAPLVQKLADERLQDALKVLQAQEAASERMGWVSYGYGRQMTDVVKWVMVRLVCMRTVGAPYEELLTFAQDYLKKERVCLFLVNEREKAGDHAEALRLLRTVLDDAASQNRPAPVWALRHAIGLYERMDDNAMVRNLLEQLVVNGSGDGDAVEWFLKLKGMCTPEEWGELRETIFERVSFNRARWRYYAAEGLFERLMDEVEDTGMSALREFESDLASHFPKRVLALHEADLMGKNGDKPDIGTTRKYYAYFAERVSHLRTIEGGDEVADRIIAKVLSTYPRRPALREELGRA